MWYDATHSLPSQAWQDQAVWLQRHIGAGAPWLVPGFRSSAPALSWLLLAWTVLTVGALGFVVWDLWRDATVTWGSRVVWPLAILLLGPLGLLAYVVSQRWPGPARSQRGTLAAWRRALGSAAWMVTGHAVGGIVIGIYLSTGTGPSSVWLRLALNYVVPLLTGLVAWLAMRRAARGVPALQGGFPLSAAGSRRLDQRGDGGGQPGLNRPAQHVVPMGLVPLSSLISSPHRDTLPAPHCLLFPHWCIMFKVVVVLAQTRRSKWSR